MDNFSRLFAEADYTISTHMLRLAQRVLPGFFKSSPRVAQNILRPDVFFLKLFHSNAFGCIDTKCIVYTCPQSLEHAVESEVKLLQVQQHSRI